MPFSQTLAFLGAACAITALVLMPVADGTSQVLSRGASIRGLDLAFRNAAGPGDAFSPQVALESGWRRETVPAARGEERWLAGDKAKHLGVSLVGTYVLASALSTLGMAESDSPEWAAGSILSLGLFKEVALDRHRAGSRASWQDLVADLAGVAAACVVWRSIHE